MACLVSFLTSALLTGALAVFLLACFSVLAGAALASFLAGASFFNSYLAGAVLATDGVAALAAVFGASTFLAGASFFSSLTGAAGVADAAAVVAFAGFSGAVLTSDLMRTSFLVLAC